MATVDSILTTLCPPLQSTIKDYAHRLRYAIPEDWTVKLFREYYPHRFQELCMIHLSFLIDIPWNFIDQKATTLCTNNYSVSTTNITTSSSSSSSAGSNNTTVNTSTPTTVTGTTTSTNAFTPFISASNVGGATKAMLKRLWINWRLSSHPVKSDRVPDGLANNIISLIDRLDNDEACCVEGLFRKSGHTIRKRQLQEAILQTSFDSKTFQWDKYSFHDLAGALKSILIRLPVPLFTERLMPLFLQVSGLRKFKNLNNHEHTDLTTQYRMPAAVSSAEASTGGAATSASLSTSSSGVTAAAGVDKSVNEKYLIHLIESKQIKALRLLIQLLPSTNLLVLKRLLQLLIRVKDLCVKNRMTTTCLGTVFGPVLLPQGILHETMRSLKNPRYPSLECHEKCLQLSSITSLLIETGLDIFLLPYSLVQDICTNSPYMTTFVLSPEKTLPDDYDTGKSNHHHHLNSRMKSCQNSRAMIKKQLMKSKDVPLISSPHHHRFEEDSPPLRTAIRFATPTPTSAANFRLLTSPIRSSTLHHQQQHCITVKHDDINSQSIASKHFLLHNYTDVTPRSKWNRSADEISLDYLQYSTDKLQQSIIEGVRDDTGKLKLDIERNCRLQTVDLSKSTVSPTHLLSSSRCCKHGKENLENTRADCSKRKMGKRRRFTELRLPSTLNRTGGGGGGHRRYFFSPCPPIPLLPFRRVGAEKRVFNSSLSPTFNDTVTTPSTTALPSW
ncbi:unnamed protein product [Heterobilharzia americana]|nr:unnamed protein product [Heterobilharzia americana]